jgi:hypothetical protein
MDCYQSKLTVGIYQRFANAAISARIVSVINNRFGNAIGVHFHRASEGFKQDTSGNEKLPL